MREFLEQLNRGTLDAYRSRKTLIREHAGIEETVLAGGYGYRQILELVQNGADAILEANEEGVSMPNGARVDVVLRNSHLYVANTGAPLSQDGLDSLLTSHTSPKRGNEIGRFGLGFKSLLRLNGRIDIFTREYGAIRFDPEACRQMIRGEFGIEKVPALRLAWPIESDTMDPLLETFNWAETVVRVEINDSSFVESLQEEIRRFPEEFLLFLDNQMTLTLDSGVDPVRQLRVEKEAGDHLLHKGEEVSRWKVFSKLLKVGDEAAIADATHIHARETIPISWGIPMDVSREEAGRFWAFFPTQTASYIPGILNAPWKLNSDRNAIIGGEWNAALMRAAAELVVNSLPLICSESDPARALDYFPRRPERKDEISAPFVEAVWGSLEIAKILPDARGEFCEAAELWRYPRENMELAHQWKELAPANSCKLFVHPFCMRNRQRLGRLNQLAERFKMRSYTDPSKPWLREFDTAKWIEQVADSDIEIALSVISLAEGLHEDCKPIEWSQLRTSLRIIPDDQWEFRKSGEVLFAPESGINNVPGHHFVHPEVAADEKAYRILHDIFGVRDVGTSAWKEMLNEALPRPHSFNAATSIQQRWQSFWDLVHAAPSVVSDEFVREHSESIKVKRRDGRWTFVDEALLPGDFVAEDEGSGNEQLLVDLNLHAEDRHRLSQIGLTDSPAGLPIPARVGNDLEDWLEESRDEYKRTFVNRANRSYLEPSSFMMPSGWKLLPRLKGAARGKLTNVFLTRLLSGEFADKIDFGHCTQEHYPRLDVAHPLTGYLMEWGVVELESEVIPLAQMVSRRHEPALSLLANWGSLKTTLDALAGMGSFHETEDLSSEEFWNPLIKYAAKNFAPTDSRLIPLWAGAAKDQIVPEYFEAESGESVELSEVFVTISTDLALKFCDEGKLVFPLDEDTAQLWIDYGARELTELIEPVWESQSGERCKLVDALPDISDVLTDAAFSSATCNPLKGLRIRVGEKAMASASLLWEGELLIDTEQLATLSRARRISLILYEISGAGWLNCDVAEALDKLGNAQVEGLRAAVSHCPSLPEKLLCAVGGLETSLKDALGSLATHSFINECTPLKLAELVLASCGPTSLSVLRNAMEEEGLKPPYRWNTAEAREFVSQLGFPLEFATSPETRRDSELMVTGPIPLPPLHDYQQEVRKGLHDLATSPDKRRRAVVSLPTGGGKTRVTVQAAVEYFLKPEGDRRRVIWIAQTDELCEQAVQAFRQVWLNVGAERTDLRIIRLWGGNRNPAVYEPSKPVVVVASIQTLNSRMGTEQLEWLKEPGLTVIDECHHAITPSYTGLLRWLDAETTLNKESGSIEPVIIGLSATPFRTDDDESQRLARRFDSQWLPVDQADLHARLRRQGVLSEVDYRCVDSGVGIRPEEEERLLELWDHRDGLDFERLVEEINQRLAKNSKRNQAIVEYIQQARAHSTLFFANSVEHAEEVAARLNLQGLPAAAISGRTPRSSRRYFLDQFQAGDIRVLCNHSVLTTGFDAPKTDVVIISRQVFSPVRYMQMVGRGLRGEANGGTPRCLIVTVMDNLGRFQDRHPYHYCAKYFSI